MRSTGFTLIELIVVMLVMGILAAVFIPRSNNPGIIVSTQAEQLAADIRYVQSLSMSRGQRYRINFTSVTTYTFTDISAVSVPHPSGTPFPISLATGVTLSPQAPLVTSYPSQIAFDGLGVPYTDQSAATKLAAMATISLAGGGTTRTIQIYPETGLVRVQ